MGVWVDNPQEFGVNNIANDIVTNRFDHVQQFSIDMKTLTVDYINDLSNHLGSLTVPETADLDVTIPNVPGLDYSGRPTFGNITLPDNWPAAAPQKPILANSPALSPVTIPVMQFAAPNFTNPNKPTASTITDPGEAPPVTPVYLPPAPSIKLPVEPILHSITVPSAPDVTVPAFSATYTEDVINVPSGFNWQKSPYNSDIWQDLLNNVLDGLKNGGTGLPPVIEAEIWKRAKDRQRIENDKAYRETEGYFAARGHQLPPGAMAGRLLEIGESILLANQNLNSDIAIKQAELTKEHQQFIVQIAVEAEKVLRGFHDAMVGRSLEAAKAVVDSGLQIYTARIEKQRLRLEKYRTDGALFENQVRAALAKVDIYRAQIDGVKATADVNQSIVSTYNAQVAAIEVTSKLYSTQLEGVKIAEEIESLKLERYKLTVTAYAERVKAEALKYEAYNTEMEGEKIKAETYAEQVKAFLAEIEAKVKEVDIEIANREAIQRDNAILIEGYKAELSGYTAEIDAVSKKTGAIVEGFKAEVAGYSAETQATSTMYTAKVKEIEANIQRASLILQKAIAEIDASTKGYLGISELQAKGLEGIANMGAQLCASALNAVNASASLGSSTSASVGQSYGHSEQISESHRYDHE